MNCRNSQYKSLVIQYDEISVTISAMGAEIMSVLKKGKEMMWDANPDVWHFSAPILFPICGRLKDSKFIYKGKEYMLGLHGFARTSLFQIESVSSDKAVFLLKSNEETKKSYPFDFEFRVIYSVDKTTVNVEYNVKNFTNGEMYFSVGAHEAYACPEGIDAYSIVFEETENLNSVNVDGGLLTYEAENIGNDVNVLPLKEEYFAIDALVFLDLKSRAVKLRNNITKQEIAVNYDGFDYLLLWKEPNAKFFCIEPWCGMPDYVNSDYDITKKKGIIKIAKGCTCVKNHSIVF